MSIPRIYRTDPRAMWHSGPLASPAHAFLRSQRTPNQGNPMCLGGKTGNRWLRNGKSFALLLPAHGGEGFIDG
jgi:hypothetical protein